MPSTYIPVARFPAAHIASHMPPRVRKTKTGEVDRRVCDHLHISGMGERTSSWLVASAPILIHHAIILGLAESFFFSILLGSFLY